jgi:hypothetical protein
MRTAAKPIRERLGWLSVRTFELDEQGSFSWIASDDDRIQRSSTALALDDGWLLIDAVDTPELDAALAGRPVLGVTYLLDRHERDTSAVAARLGAPVLVPAVLAGRGEPLDLPGVQERVIASLVGWNESALWLPDRGLLVCVEALGTAPYFLARPGDRLGVHAFLRLRPPRGALGGLPVRALAVGHGEPLRGQLLGAEIDLVLARARRDLPRLLGRALAQGGRRLARRRRAG